MRATPFLSFSCWNNFFYDCQCLKCTVEQDDFTKITLSIGWLLFTLLTVETYNLSSKVPNENEPTALSRFKNVIFRHHYVMQKNSRCTETEKSFLCKVLHFNSQNLMLIGPPNDWATAYSSYWKYLTEHSKIAWDVPRNVFFIILATAISGMPAPEICFLPEQFRLTNLPKEHHGESLSVCELDTQPSSWEVDALSLNYRRPSEIFINA